MEVESREELLTDQENAVYDRQIRVWGVDAQKRLSKARILVAGLTGVIAEACKNIVLAGIKSLTLMDDIVNINMAAAHFLTPIEQLQNCENSVVAIWMNSLKDFNPLVEVLAEEGNLLDKPDSFINNFDAVIIGRSTFDFRKKVSALYRKSSHRIAFYAVDCRGALGEIFVDLQNHSFTSQRKGNDIQLSQKFHFNSLEDVLAVPWKCLPKKMSKVFFAMRIIEEFEQTAGRKPGEVSLKDLEEVTTLQKQLCEAQGVAESLVPVKLLQRILNDGCKEFPPVSAIIGGILGQEVIKAMSGKGEPLKNFFFFDALDGKGLIEDISMPILAKGPAVYNAGMVVDEDILISL